MPPNSPLTPRTRQRRIQNGRQRFEELKKARIARMRDAAAEEADMLSLIAATPAGLSSDAGSESSDTEDELTSEQPRSPKECLVSRSCDSSPLKGSSSPAAQALARERSLRFKAEEARKRKEAEDRLLERTAAAEAARLEAEAKSRAEAEAVAEAVAGAHCSVANRCWLAVINQNQQVYNF